MLCYVMLCYEIRLCWTRSETNGESFQRCPATERKAIRWEVSRRKTRPGRLTKPAIKICKSIMVERSGITLKKVHWRLTATQSSYVKSTEIDPNYVKCRTFRNDLSRPRDMKVATPPDCKTMCFLTLCRSYRRLKSIQRSDSPTIL